MNKLLAIIGGLIAMGCGVILVVFVWTKEFVYFAFGLIPIILFVGGLITLIAGINGLKEDIETPELEGLEAGATKAVGTKGFDKGPPKPK